MIETYLLQLTAVVMHSLFNLARSGTLARDPNWPYFVVTKTKSWTLPSTSLVANWPALVLTLLPSSGAPTSLTILVSPRGSKVMRVKWARWDQLCLMRAKVFNLAPRRFVLARVAPRWWLRVRTSLCVCGIHWRVNCEMCWWVTAMRYSAAHSTTTGIR